MSDDASDVEARVLQLEREVYRIHRRVIPLETHRTRALEEGLAMAWTQIRNRCITTLHGTIFGGRCVGWLGATARFVGYGSGINYGTATADGSGAYSISMILDEADLIAGLLWNVYMGHTVNGGGRLDESVIAFSFSVGGICVDNLQDLLDPAAHIQVPAAGYRYPSASNIDPGPYDYPIKSTLNCDDSGSPGTFALTTASPGSAWQGTHGGRTYTLQWPGFWRLAVSGLGLFTETSNVAPDGAMGANFSVNFNLGGGRTVAVHES